MTSEWQCGLTDGILLSEILSRVGQECVATIGEVWRYQYDDAVTQAQFRDRHGFSEAKMENLLAHLQLERSGMFLIDVGALGKGVLLKVGFKVCVPQLCLLHRVAAAAAAAAAAAVLPTVGVITRDCFSQRTAMQNGESSTMVLCILLAFHQ